MLAFGPSAWPVDLTAAEESLRLELSNQSLSASGTGIQGSHIVHPAGNGLVPASRCDRVWVLAPTAALAEIWSTALMLMDPSEIPSLITGDPEITPVYLEIDGSLRSLKS